MEFCRGHSSYGSWPVGDDEGSNSTAETACSSCDGVHAQLYHNAGKSCPFLSCLQHYQQAVGQVPIQSTEYLGIDMCNPSKGFEKVPKHTGPPDA